jgi:putative peptidoglycan lipid II flippase
VTDPQPAAGTDDSTGGAGAGSGGLLRSSSVMAAGTVVSRLLGFVRSAVLAAAIGLATVNGMFTLANTVPNIVYILLAGGVINAVFVPQIVRAMQNPDGGRAYTDRLLTVAGTGLLVVTVAVTLAAPLIVAIYTGGELSASDVSLARAFAFWCLPQVFFYGVYTMLGQVLNARGSFGPMMWAPIANNVVVIAVLLVFMAVATVDFRDSSSVSAGEIALLGGGTTLGLVVQSLVLVPVLRRTGFGFRPRFDIRGHGLGRAGSLAKWTLLFVLVNQVAYAVVVNLATSAGKLAEDVGGPGLAGYSNAYLIFILPHSIVTVSVVTALLPRMSAAAASGRMAEVRDDLSTGWRLTAVALVPAAFGFLVLADDATRVIFAGAGAADARAVGLVVAGFAPGLLAFSAQYLTLRGFYALEDTRTPFLIQVVVAGVNVGLALLAAAVLPARWVVVGLAGAYSLAYVVGLATSVAVLRRRTGGVDGRRVVRTYVRLILAALPAAVVAALVVQLTTSAAGSGVAGSLTAVAAGGTVLLAGYLGLARLLRVRELSDLLGMVRRRGRG